MKSLREFELISACDSIESLADALLSIAKKYGFQSVLFGLKPTKTSNCGDAFISTNYATAWRDIYQQDRLHLVDPVVNHARHQVKPLLWNQSTFRTSDECALYERAVGFGLQVGITL